MKTDQKYNFFAAIGFVAIIFSLFTSFTSALLADVKLPDVFASGMVLQRDLPAPVWGWADPQEKITVTIGDQSQTTETNEDGRWQVKLNPLKAANKPTKLIVKGKNEIVLENILVGEVWLCSGQSNMAWTMNKLPDSKADIPSINNVNIRLFQVKHETAQKPVDHLTPTIKWQSAEPKSVTHFSSIGYYFGAKLNEELDVPIGLIDSSWGATRIEPWTTVDGFKSVSIPSVVKLADVKLSEKPNQQQPTALYNKMIHPLTPFAMRGVIWYQGEGNLNDKMIYAEKMKALIAGWRKVFNNAELGFYYVQLAPFRYGNVPTSLPQLWEAQAEVEKQVSKSGMVVINDIGNINDIHPKNKKIVALRLAAQALNKTYGKKEIACESPKFEKLTIDGESVVISFTDVKEFKTRDGKSPDWFEIAGENKEYHKADAVIVDKTKIKLTSDKVSKPVHVRFAWSQIAEPNLRNESDLQLGAFRTDKE
ncbi:MAG: sialate O-acetylesterase [Planctomycetaceae bacterium]|jgi:sialate O-acetylesterase|nr:sialate O-acetylesterase [Planctomycetaceae bacterium]